MPKLTKIINFLTLFTLLLGGIQLYVSVTNVYVEAAPLNCVENRVDGTKECPISTSYRRFSLSAPAGIPVDTNATMIFRSRDGVFLGITRCQYRESNYETGQGGCGLAAIKNRSIGTVFTPTDADTIVDFYNQDSISGLGSINTGYQHYQLDDKLYIVDTSKGNYVIKDIPGGTLRPSDYANFKLTSAELNTLQSISASQIGSGASNGGATSVQAAIIDRAKLENQRIIAAGGPGTECLDPLLDSNNQPIIRCTKGGKFLGPDGQPLADDCRGFKQSALSAAAGTTIAGSGVTCVREAEIETVKTLAANKVAEQIAPGTNTNSDTGDIFQFLFGIVIFIVTLLLWVANNGLIVALWLLGTMFVFFLRLNPAGAVSGGSVLFEIWRLLYGVANFLVLVSFIWIGFRQILGGSKGQKTSVRKFLQNIIVIALSLNFTILGAATVVNIAQGVGDVALFGYVSVNDYSYLPKSGNDSVDTNAKISAALIGDYIKAVGGASNLHCSVKDKDNQCDTSKLGPEDLASFGNFQQAVDVSGKAFGDKVTDFINEFLLFLVLAISIVTVFGRLTWRAIRRIFVLVALMVGSPIILVGFFSDIPQLKSSATGWWKAFISNTLFYPLAVFSLIVSGVFINKFATLIRQVNSTTTSASITSLINPVNWVQGFSVVAQDTAAVTTDTTSPLKAYYGIISLIVAGVVMYSVALFLDKSTESVSDTVVANFGGLLTGDGRKSSGVGSSLDKDKTSSKPTATGPAAALKSIAGKALVGGAKLTGGIATGGASLVLSGGAGIAGKAIGGVGGALSTVAGKARTLLAGRSVKSFIDKNTYRSTDGSTYLKPDSVKQIDRFRDMVSLMRTMGGLPVRIIGRDSGTTQEGSTGSSTGTPLISGPVFSSRSGNSTNSNDNYKATTDRVNTYSQDDTPKFGETRKLNGPAPAGAIDVKAVTVGESIVSKPGGNSSLSKSSSGTSNIETNSDGRSSSNQNISSRPAGVQAALPPSGPTSSSRSSNNAYAGAQTAYTQSSAQQGNTTIAASPASKASSGIATPNMEKVQPTAGNYAEAQKQINQGAQPTNYSGIKNEPSQSNNSASNSTPSIERSAIAIPSITVEQPEVDASAYKASYTPQAIKSTVQSAPETQVSTPTPTRTSFTPQPQRQSTDSTYTQTIEIPSSPIPDSIPVNLSQTDMDISKAANNIVSSMPNRNSGAMPTRDMTPTKFAQPLSPKK